MTQPAINGTEERLDRVAVALERCATALEQIKQTLDELRTTPVQVEPMTIDLREPEPPAQDDPAPRQMGAYRKRGR